MWPWHRVLIGVAAADCTFSISLWFLIALFISAAIGLPWWWILLGNHNVCFMKLWPGVAIPSVYVDGWDESAHHWGMKGCKASGNSYIVVTLAISIQLNYIFPQVLMLFMYCFIVLLSCLFIGSSRQHEWKLSISFL